MGIIELHPDFKDFLRLLNSHGVEYLIVGGYAVGYYGYPRATGDLDIWVPVQEENAEKTAKVLGEFGMPPEKCVRELFLEKDKIIRMGVPPVRIEVITGASGVCFAECYSRKVTEELDGFPVHFIALNDLRRNKKAAGRYKDLEDLKHLPSLA